MAIDNSAHNTSAPFPAYPGNACPAALSLTSSNFLMFPRFALVQEGIPSVGN